MRVTHCVKTVLAVLCLAVPFAAFGEGQDRADEARAAAEAAKDAAVEAAEALRTEHGLNEEEAREIADAYRRGGDSSDENHGERVSALVRDALAEDCRGECLAGRLRELNAPAAAERAAEHRARGDDTAAAARERGAATSGAAREGAIGRDSLPDAAGRAGAGRRGR